MARQASAVCGALHTRALFVDESSEHWCSMLQRTRLRSADFASKDHFRVELEQFIGEWNQQA
jgi:hypothetical protein